ncbi:hypothetical protein BDN67DRAFT_912149, partial [Paxillus ammoniavirescens]
DYCLTFPSEVHHAWGRKWDITRIVFTISRYLTFVASAMMCFCSFRNLSYMFSNDPPITQTTLTATKLACPSFSNVCIISAEVILILRTYALWGHSRRVLVVLIALGVVSIFPMYEYQLRWS